MARTWQPSFNAPAPAAAPAAEAEEPSFFEMMGNSFAASQLATGGSSLWDDAMSMGSELLEDASDAGHDLLVDAVVYAEDSGLADAVVNGIGDGLDTAEDAIDFVGDVGSDVLDAGGDLVDWAVDTSAPLIEEAGELVTPLVEEGGEVLDWVVDQGSDLVAPLVEEGGEILDWAIEEGSDLVAPLVEAGEEAVTWALDEGADLLRPALDLGGEVFGWLMDKGSELGQGISDLWHGGAEVLEDIAEIFGADTANSGPLSEALSEEQMAFLHQLYGDSLDLSQIRYTRDGLTPMIAGAPNTLGNTVNLVSKWGPQIFDENGKVTPEGMELVIHELTHSWQYQNGGWDYMPEAIWANAYHTVVDGDRDEAYRYDTSMEWGGMNPEQQGHAIEHAGYLMWRQSQGEVLTADELKTLAEHQKYVDALRAGEGA